MNLDKNIRYIDFHTHHAMGTDDTVAVMNLMAGEDIPEKFSPNTAFSTGIHPWYLTAEMLGELKTGLILTASHPHVIIIGEAGFDQLHGPSYHIQNDAFIFQVEIAEELKKPMIIHCVRGWDSLGKAHKTVRPEMNWVIHGFRGDIRLAASLVNDGFWFSLGLKGLTDKIVKVIPEDRILLETDDSRGSIDNVYRLYSELTNKDPVAVCDRLRTNFNNLFQN
mgnify:CR=1 FL=1